jgi:hypothetical protein
VAESLADPLALALRNAYCRWYGSPTIDELDTLDAPLWEALAAAARGQDLAGEVSSLRSRLAALLALADQRTNDKARVEHELLAVRGERDRWRQRCEDAEEQLRSALEAARG